MIVRPVASADWPELFAAGSDPEIWKVHPTPDRCYTELAFANFYVGPLVAMMEKAFKLTRSEWIVLFCLTRQPRLNAQQISIVTGRPKTSIASAVKLLQKKNPITRRPISPTAGVGSCI